MVEPAHILLPTWDRTLGDEVAAVCELAGFGPDPEQKLGLDITFALNAQGRSAAAANVCLCCRQNLKTGEIKQTELGWLFVTDERLVLHTAHEFDTSREAYRDLKDIIDGSSFLRRRIKYMHDTPADMSIETLSGARLVFKTRTKGQGVGKSPRKIVLDEGFALHPEHMSAVRYAMSAQPDPQMIVASSACHEDSDVLRTFVRRGREGKDPRLGYREWCSRPPKEACASGEACTHVYGEAVGCALDNMDEIQRANPLMGRRLDPQTVLDERRETITIALAAKHGRERAGWHDDPIEGSSAIDADAWRECGDEASSISATSTVALGLDVRDDSLAAAIAAAGLNGDGLMHGEITGNEDGVLDARPGLDWVVPRLNEIADNDANHVCVLVLDPTGPAGAFITKLTHPKTGRFAKCTPGDDAPSNGRHRLYLIGAREYAQACGALVNDTREKAWRHIDQEPLAMAVDGVRTRDLADAFAWDRDDSVGDISPLVAVTLARHGHALFGEAVAPEPWVL